jgi:hypothetical protein
MGPTVSEPFALGSRLQWAAVPPRYDSRWRQGYHAARSSWSVASGYRVRLIGQDWEASRLLRGIEDTLSGRNRGGRGYRLGVAGRLDEATALCEADDQRLSSTVGIAGGRVPIAGDGLEP